MLYQNLMLGCQEKHQFKVIKKNQKTLICLCFTVSELTVSDGEESSG